MLSISAIINSNIFLSADYLGADETQDFRLRQNSFPRGPTFVENMFLCVYFKMVIYPLPLLEALGNFSPVFILRMLWGSLR